MRRSSPLLFSLVATGLVACTVPNPNAQGNDESETSGDASEGESGSTDADESASGSGEEGENTSGGPECDEGLTDCEGECVNLQNDDANCSACGIVCGEGWSCGEGACLDARSWDQSLRVDDENAIDAEDVALAFAPSGDAFVGFTKYDGGANAAQIAVARLPNDATQWGIPEQVSLVQGGQPSDFDLDIDSDGVALAVWSDNFSQAPFEAAYAARWDAGGQSWQTGNAAAIADSVLSPTLVADETGSAAIAWVEVSDPRRVRATRWDTVTSGWTAPEAVHTPSSNLIDASSLRIASHGDEFACSWFENDALEYGTFAGEFNPNDGWLNAVDVGPFDESTKLTVAFDFDDEGNQLIVWRQGLGAGNTLRASVRLSGENTWSEPVDLEITEAGDINEVDIEVAGTRAFAVWDQDDGNRRGVWLAEFDLEAAAWAAPEFAEPDEEEEGYGARVFATPEGNAHVLWFRNAFGGTNGQLMARQRHAGTGWNEAAIVEVVDGGVLDLHVDGNANGDLMATWTTEGDASTEVWAAAFKVQR